MANGVYLFGGWTNYYSSDFLPNNSKTWRKGPSLPKKLFGNLYPKCRWQKSHRPSYFCSNEFCMLDGLKISKTEFVLIGVGEYHDKLLKYDIVAKKWTQFNLIIGRHGHSSAFINGKIIISGGKRVVIDAVDEYLARGTEIIDTSTWTSRIVGGFNETMVIRPLPNYHESTTQTRLAHGTAIMTINNEERLLAFGGTKKGTDRTENCEYVFIPEEYMQDGEPIFMDSCKLWDDENEEWVATDFKLRKARKEIRSLSIPWLEKTCKNFM